MSDVRSRSDNGNVLSNVSKFKINFSFAIYLMFVKLLIDTLMTLSAQVIYEGGFKAVLLYR